MQSEVTGKKAVKRPTKSEASKRTSEAMKVYWAKKREALAKQPKPAPVRVTAPVQTPKSSQHLSTEEVKALIEACGTHGVISFRYRDLQLLFKKSIDQPMTGPIGQRSGHNVLRPLEGASVAPQTSGLQEASDVAEEHLEHLKITDPAAYEEFIQSEDADGGDGDQ